MIKLVERMCLNENCLIDQSKTYRFNRITYGKEYADSLTIEVVIPNVRSDQLDMGAQEPTTDMGHVNIVPIASRRQVRAQADKQSVKAPFSRKKQI